MRTAADTPVAGVVDIRRALWWAYELTMAVLAFFVLWLLTTPERAWTITANWTIWGIFSIDYVVRVARADDRRRFVRTHIPELISILPLDALRIFRIARLIRVVRAGIVLWRVTKDLRSILGTNGLGYVLMFSASVMCGGAVAVWHVEPAMNTFGDALWWSIVTATTVGYGDISPASPVGRLVAVALMIVGIGTLGMVTGSIATHFLGNRERTTNPDIAHVQDRLAEWDQLDRTERRRLIGILHAIEQAESGSGATA